MDIDNLQKIFELVEELIQDAESPAEKVKVIGGVSNAIKSMMIRAYVAGQYGIDAALLSGTKRDSKTILARQLAMFLCREITDASPLHIGIVFGDRDFGSVMHAFLSVTDNMESDTAYKENVERMLNELKGCIIPSQIATSPEVPDESNLPDTPKRWMPRK